MLKLATTLMSATLATGMASADPLLEMMRAHTSDGPIYAYEMQYADGDFAATGRIDPSQPEGKRIDIVTPDKSTWSDEFRQQVEEIDAETTGDIWCTDFAETVPTNAERTGETATEATYVFIPLPDEDADNAEKKLLKKVEARIVLDKTDGAILRYTMTLTKPVKPVIVAKVNSFDLNASCSRAPDGRTYMEDFSLAISGSAMMKAFEESTSRKITTLLDPVG